MAQSGFTPILIYASGTASAAPSAGNLTSGSTGAELALNYNDGVLYYKDSSGVVQVLSRKSHISGSGTTNYVSKFTTSSTIGNSVIYDDGTNVGIGTSSPSGAKLIVSQNTANVPTILRVDQLSSGNSFDYSSVKLTAAGITGAGMVAWSTGSIRGGTFWVQTDTAIPLVLGTNDTERMRIDSSGRVGINTSSPITNASLTVNTYTSTDNAFNKGMYVGNGGAQGGYIGSRTISANQRQGLYVSSDQMLTLWGDASADGFGVLDVVSGASPSPSTDTNSLFRINSTGLVGIGTAEPQARLQVTGGSLLVTTSDYVNASTGSLLQISSGASTGNTYYALGAYSSGGNAWNNLVLQSGGGNVGIGTSNPAYTLDVNGVINSNDSIAVTKAGSDSIGSGPYFYLRNAVAASSAWVTQLGASGTFDFWNYTTGPGWSRKVTIDSSGNVGIGTASPTSKLTLVGNSSTFCLTTNNIVETVNVSNTAATGTIDYDLTTQSVVYYQANATGNWTINFRITSLGASLATGQATTAVFMATQGSTAYYNTTVQIDGTTSGVTTKWQGGSAPASGYPSGIDVYTYSIIKTGSSTYTVLASQTQFA